MLFTTGTFPQIRSIWNNVRDEYTDTVPVQLEMEKAFCR
jgi:hypothetical protein